MSKENNSEKPGSHVDTLKVKGVPKEMKRQLVNVAKNKGVTTSAFLKTEFSKILAGFDSKMKEAPKL